MRRLALATDTIELDIRGWVGLWVGNTSPGDFANVTITRAGQVRKARAGFTKQ